MAIEEIATSLVSMCREGQFSAAIEAHYAPDIVSVEATGNDQMPAVMRGIDAVRQKTKWWVDNHDVHATEIQGPFYNQDEFCMFVRSDVTFKPTGAKTTLTEVCRYQVKNDKIVTEYFYYDVSQMGA